MRLNQKIAVVTGAGAGIGRAIAERLGAEGATVVAADFNEAAAKETQRRVNAAGGHAQGVYMDVRDPDCIADVYAQIEKQYGQLNFQVSTAGITDRMPFLSMSLQRFENVLRTNLVGTILCGQAAGRLMVKYGGGRIVNFTSVSGQLGGTGRAAYGASKAAIINLTQTMAMELAEHGILVNAIAPGPTQVERTAHGPAQREAFLCRMAIQRYATPAEIAAAAFFLCSDDASFVTGHVLNVDGGFASSGVHYDPSKGEV
ncbi:MAG: oxidoreductase [Herminiimonas sp.]|nr:oxidoreductase [Herminiimonas sp.]